MQVIRHPRESGDLVIFGWLIPLFISHIVCAATMMDGAHKNKSPHRIISLAPDITETLFAIGASDRIVGVIGGSDYPLAARRITQVGSYSGVDLEKIISLHPDLIITWGNTFTRQMAVFKKMGIPVYKSQPRYLEDIPRLMKNLGHLIGTEKKANQAAKNFSLRLAYLRQKYQTRKPVTVFYQIGDYSLITINKESWINQVIELCGGRNVFSHASFIAPEVSWESVVVANPQVIINGTANENWKMRWQQWSSISAVSQHNLFSVSPDLIDRAGPRLLDGAVQICEDLQMARRKVE